jgi:exopolysaccharide biosynthesis polyprenyl glycosylphosphotransferase
LNGEVAAEAVSPLAIPAPAHHLRSRGWVVRRALALADCVAISAALAAALLVVDHLHHERTTFAEGLLTLPAWILLFKLYGLYDSDSKRIGHSTVDEVPRLFHVLLVGSLGIWLVLRFADGHSLTLAQGITFLFGSFAALLACRTAARALVRRFQPAERVLLVGGGPTGRLLLRKIGLHREYHLEPIGYLDGIRHQSNGLSGELPYLGPVTEAKRLCEALDVERVIVVAPAVDEDLITDLIRDTGELAVRVTVVPNHVDTLGPAVELDNIEGLTVLGINPPRLTRSSRLLKRTMDIAIAASALLLILPLLVVAAIAVRLDSDGPAFFSQVRVGRQGRRFRLYKLRTMVVDADEQVEALLPQSLDPSWLLLEHDPRITRIGHFLRRTSIDELPQLWNVLKGDMSLVGPRPLTVDTQLQIGGWGARRLQLTPGLTGPWQVLGRTSIPFEEMVKLDYLYVTNWSLWEDVRLLIRTPLAVIRARGAN